MKLDGFLSKYTMFHRPRNSQVGLAQVLSGPAALTKVFIIQIVEDAEGVS
jgi:hypothetical protein